MFGLPRSFSLFILNEGSLVGEFEISVPLKVVPMTLCNGDPTPFCGDSKSIPEILTSN